MQIEDEYGGGDANCTASMANFVAEHDLSVPWTLCCPHDVAAGRSAFAAAAVVTCNGRLRHAVRGRAASGTCAGRECRARACGPRTSSGSTRSARASSGATRAGSAATSRAGWRAGRRTTTCYDMWMGGNMYGNWPHPVALAFGLWHTPAYADDAPAHAGGTPNEPTLSHSTAWRSSTRPRC